MRSLICLKPTGTSFRFPSCQKHRGHLPLRRGRVATSRPTPFRPPSASPQAYQGLQKQVSRAGLQSNPSCRWVKRFRALVRRERPSFETFCWWLTTSKPRASAAFESASTQLAAKLPQEVLMGSHYGDLSALMFLVVTRVEFTVWVVHGGALEHHSFRRNRRRLNGV